METSQNVLCLHILILAFPLRFMLQLAQKTNGVIVTNDNLRDLLDDSPVWRDIIKKRCLLCSSASLSWWG